MLRFAEVALFVAPFAAYALWRRLEASKAVPSRGALGMTLAGLVLLGAVLAWLGARLGAPPDTRYVPARLVDGRVVPGHAEPGPAGP